MAVSFLNLYAANMMPNFGIIFYYTPGNSGTVTKSQVAGKTSNMFSIQKKSSRVLFLYRRNV